MSQTGGVYGGGSGIEDHDYSTFYEADYIMRFLLKEYGDDLCTNSQSMVAIREYNDDADKSQLPALEMRQELYSFIKYICYEMFEYRDMQEIARNDKTLLDHLLGCIGNMIGNEMIISNDGGYYVFYRSVRENIILYEFNTLMLRLFAENKDYWNLGSSSRGDEPTPLICTANILESEYDKNIDGIFDKIKRKGMPNSEFSHMLLSVNNCMIPKNSIYNFHRQRHGVEASPLSFRQGYHIHPQWKDRIGEVLQRFFSVSETKASEFIKGIEDIYRKNQHMDDDDIDIPTPFNHKTGHLLQICIPRNVVDHFAYTAIEYGFPSTAYVLEGGDHVGQSPFKKPPPDAVRQLTFHEIMKSEDMANLQSRILAHPNLFLRHGAFTNVVSANPLFNRKTFQDDLSRLLHPLITQAQMQGKRLHFDKYTDLQP
jgi:hypothetical protein